tara:strand:+ start:5586 stop:5876 length:291 start_codon:yes stop_codon:yes gene_type:complete
VDLEQQAAAVLGVLEEALVQRALVGLEIHLQLPLPKEVLVETLQHQTAVAAAVVQAQQALTAAFKVVVLVVPAQHQALAALQYHMLAAAAVVVMIP